MFVRLVLYQLEPGNRAPAEALAADLGPAIRARQGCQSVTFFGDETDGQYGIFVLWDSRENAESAREVIGPRLQQHLAGRTRGEPVPRLFEVIQ